MSNLKKNLLPLTFLITLAVFLLLSIFNPEILWCSWDLYIPHCLLESLMFPALNHSVVSDSLCYGLVLGRLLCPWNSPGKNTGVGCHFLLQGIFLTQGLNSCLLCDMGSIKWTPVSCTEGGFFTAEPLGKIFLIFHIMYRWYVWYDISYGPNMNEINKIQSKYKLSWYFICT